MPTLSPRAHSFAFKLLLAAALVALGDLLFFQHKLSYGWLGLYAAAVLAALLLARPAVRRDRRALAAWGAGALYAAAMVWDANPLAFLLFLIAAGLATLLPGTARLDDGWRWFQRLVVHGLRAPFGPLIDLAKLQRTRRHRPAGRLSLRSLLPNLALPLVGTALFIWLFAVANPVIDGFIASLSLPEPSAELIGRLILWGLLGLLAWGVLRPRRARRLLPALGGDGTRSLPGVNPASVLLSLVLFNLLFAVQNAMDFAWLWRLLPLPEGMTLARYAHRGAYPLIVTALLAALFVLVTLRPGAATAQVPAIRRLVLLWIGQNVVLVASSMLRTLDYVDAYSLTRLRIAALVWMGLVAVGLVLIAWRLVKARTGAWLINANLAAAAALLTLYAFVDTGAVAAQWNVRHAREIDGTGARLDLCYLNRLGSSALPALVELEQRPLEPDLRARVIRVRQQVQDEVERRLAGGGWTLLDQRRLDRAPRTPEPQALPATVASDCHGRIQLPDPAPPPALTPAQEQ